MSEQTDEQMTGEQLNEAIYYLRKLCAVGTHSSRLLMQIETLAREGLKLREEERAWRATSDSIVVDQHVKNAALTAELDSLRADKERLDWLDSLPDKTEFTPSQHGTTIRTAIDSARKDKA